MPQAQTVQTIVSEAEELFTVVMDLYAVYLDQVEQLIQEVPETETRLLRELDAQMQEIQSAMDHDVAVFDQAIQSDLEDIHQFKDKLRINEIYKLLKS